MEYLTVFQPEGLLSEEITVKTSGLLKGQQERHHFIFTCQSQKTGNQQLEVEKLFIEVVWHEHVTLKLRHGCY